MTQKAHTNQREEEEERETSNLCQNQNQNQSQEQQRINQSFYIIYQEIYKMINNLKHELRKRPTYDEMLKQAITSKLKTTVILQKYNKGMLLCFVSLL